MTAFPVVIVVLAVAALVLVGLGAIVRVDLWRRRRRIERRRRARRGYMDGVYALEAYRSRCGVPDDVDDALDVPDLWGMP